MKNTTEDVLEDFDYSEDGVWGDYISITFRRCNFTGARIGGKFVDCTFESDCTYEDTLWSGTFIGCRGVGQ